jgi:hypothetical protein
VLRAPERLDWGIDEFVVVIQFLEKLRRMALEGDRPVLLDMRGCNHIVGPCSLMLAAEVERCVMLKPGCLAAIEPKDPRVRWHLTVYGVFDLLGMKAQGRLTSAPGIMKIVSGGRGEAEDAPVNPGELTYKVAELAREAFDDKSFVDHLHSALNEATDNVIGHAYDEELIDVATCVAGRWWVSGLANPQANRAFFFVLDQGATIPGTAPKTFGEHFLSVLSAIGIKSLSEVVDHQVLRATIAQKRTQTGLGERGKGLAHMIGLINDVTAGAVFIYSGSGYYIFTRAGEDAEPFESSGSLAYRFPGTLIIWQVEGMKKDAGATSANG